MAKNKKSNKQQPKQATQPKKQFPEGGNHLTEEQLKNAGKNEDGEAIIPLDRLQELRANVGGEIREATKEQLQELERRQKEKYVKGTQKVSKEEMELIDPLGGDTDESENYVEERKEKELKNFPDEKDKTLKEAPEEKTKTADPSPGALLNDAIKQPITEQRWLQAQEAEVKAHNNDTRSTSEHYAETYKKYFKYVGLGTDLQGLHIIEIGPAMFPALAICSGYEQSVIIEPIHSEPLFSFVRHKGILLLDEPLEQIPNHQLEEMRNSLEGTIEVWLFNVMQHVIDPDTFVAKCKLLADRIRFFEPIDTPYAEHHPHTYTIEDYDKYFGDGTNVDMYKGGTEPGFHTADCAYGVWIR